MRHLTIFLVVAGQAMAHHSAAPHYDLQKELSLSATVTKFEFVNPHGYVFFNTPDGAAWQIGRAHV